MKKYNPFRGLIETKKFPHARTYRTSFLGKMKYTFFVFFGNNAPAHAGIFDYLTLGLHYLVNEFIVYLWSGAFDVTLREIALLIWNLPRFIVAGVLTLICSPFVGIAHIVSNFIAGSIKNEALSYEVEEKVCQLDCRKNLPSDYPSPKYREQFIFISQTNTLIWIDANGVENNLAIEDIQELRKTIDAEFSVSHIGGYRFEDINKCLKKPLKPQIKTFKKILEDNGLDLDSDILSLSIELEDEQKIGLAFRRNPPCAFLKLSLSLYSQKDLTFFTHLRELNIGQIQANIEEDRDLAARLG